MKKDLINMKALLESRFPNAGEFINDHDKAIMLYINRKYDIEILGFESRKKPTLIQLYLWEHSEPYSRVTNCHIIESANVLPKDTPQALDKLLRHAQALSVI